MNEVLAESPFVVVPDGSTVLGVNTVYIFRDHKGRV